MDNFKQEFSNYTVLDSQQTANPATGAVAKKFMANVFAWMFLAVGISALMSLLFAYVPTFQELLYVQGINRYGKLVSSWTGLGMIVTFAPLLFVLVMSFAFRSLSATLLTLFFIAYATLVGMSLSVVLLVYTSGSVIGVFGAASAMFGVMAVLGYTTDKDLTSFGRIMMMGLIGIVIAMVINFFIGSSQLDYIISIVGVAVFTGLTAYDTQKIKRIGAGVEYEGTNTNDTRKLAIMGALNLYLDFLNLFLMLLRLFGSRK